jgi:hypothetical protein
MEVFCVPCKNPVGIDQAVIWATVVHVSRLRLTITYIILFLQFSLYV